MFLALTVVLNCAFVIVSSFNYNDPCTSTPQCDRSRFLECVNNRCLCLPGESNYILNVCRILANRPCTSSGEGIQPCAPHSTCIGTPNQCTCAPNFTPNAKNQCFLHYGQTCSVDADPVECDPLTFLLCNPTEAECGCDENDAKYDPLIPACLLLVESRCNASIGNQNCVANSKCRQGFCACDYPFVQNSQRECSLPYGETCEEGVGRDLCSTDRYLTCGPGKRCICSNPLNSWYNTLTGFCHIKANKPCQGSGSGQPCVPHSDCVNSQCICQGDFEPNSSGQCVLGFGKTCDPGHVVDQCDQETFTFCSPTTNKCTCTDGLNTFYDPVAKTCRLLANSTCTPGGSQNCVNQAHCSTIENICKCNPGFEMSINRQCIIPYGKPCDVNLNQCDSANFQECNIATGICDCQGGPESIYNFEAQKCFLRHAASCSLGDPNANQQCAANSMCDPDTKQCICTGMELLPNDLRLCVLGHGKSCSKVNDQCDIYGYMECTPNSSTCGCQRPNDTWYDPAIKKCTLRSGSACSPNVYAQQCIQRSTCKPTGGQIPYECFCNGNMIPSKNRKCLAGYDSNCDVITDYCDREDGFMTCDQDTNLCKCMRIDMVYDAEAKECFVLPGGTCSPISGNPSCGHNAICSAQGICACGVGFEDTGFGTCLKSYGISCNLDAECNHHSHLICSGEKCICPVGRSIPELNSTTGKVTCVGSHGESCSEQNLPCSRKSYLACSKTGGFCECLSPIDQRWFSQESKCLSLAGSPCHLNTPPEVYSLQCIQNATCYNHGNGTGNEIYGVCVCDTGHKQNHANMCDGSPPIALISKELASLVLLVSAMSIF